MKVYLEEYNPNWPIEFEDIKGEISQQLHFLNPVIEHIGSTSIIHLKAKPIIDIMVGLNKLEDLNESISPLIQREYIYYEIYNSVMPYRRFFVKLKNKPENFHIPTIYNESDEIPNELNAYKLAHIHVLEYNSYHWNRHIAFRNYIQSNESVKREYEILKSTLSLMDWKDGNDYNAAKNEFIKQTEATALEWYLNSQS